MRNQRGLGEDPSSPVLSSYSFFILCPSASSFSSNLTFVFNLIFLVASLAPFPFFPLTCGESPRACPSPRLSSGPPFPPHPHLAKLPTDFTSPLEGLQFMDGCGRASPPSGWGGGFLRGVPQSSQKGQTAFWLPSVESQSESPVLLWVSKSHLWAKRIIKTFSQTFEAAFQTASCQFPS